MHAATTTILEAASPPLPQAHLNQVRVVLRDVLTAVNELRRFDVAFQALKGSVPAPDGRPDRYSAFTQARQAVLGGGVDFTARLNCAVDFLISQCKADPDGLDTLIHILNDPDTPGSGVNQLGDTRYAAIQRLKSHIPRLSAAHVVDLYATLRGAAGPLNQGAIRADLVQRLTTLGVAEMNGAHDLDAILLVAGEWGGRFDAIGVAAGRRPDLGAGAALTALVGDSADAEALMRLYAQVNAASPALSGAIKDAVVERLRGFGQDAVRAAGNLAGVRRAYGRHFAVLGVDKPDLGDDAAILGRVTAKLTEPDLTMASIMTYYAEETHDLGGLPREALKAIETALLPAGGPGAAPGRLQVDTFVQFVNHLSEFHVALTGDDAAATDKMTALLDRIIPFLPADMELADIARIYGEITDPDDQALLAAPLAGPLVADMGTPAELLELLGARGDLGKLGRTDEVKSVLTSRLSELAQAAPSGDADAYIAFVTNFHAAYTALSSDGFAVIGAAKLPDNLRLEGVRRINTGLAEHAPNALVVVMRPSLIKRVLSLATDDGDTLPNIVQNYVPVLGALGLDREEALTHLTDILRPRLSNIPAGLAEQFGQLEDYKAALRPLF